MREQLIRLRKIMEKNHIDAYLVPTTDFHGSEYINDYFKCREYISGFTGSAGTLLVTSSDAFLWTDGRYFLQAAEQLDGSGIQLMKMNQNGVPTILEYLSEYLRPGEVLGFDGRMVSGAFYREMEEAFLPKGICLSFEDDLVNQIWSSRPAIIPSKVYSLPEEFTGESTPSKLARLENSLTKETDCYHLLTNLEEIAWLFNLRGSDIEYTPVFFAYALIGNGSAVLYVMDKSLSGSWSCPCVQIKDYDKLADDLQNLKGTIWLDKKSANCALINLLSSSVKIVDKPSPVQMMKAIKNPTEISSTKATHVKDGVAMVNFIYWLKNNIGTIPMTEISVAECLESYRRNQEGCYDLSFDTICGYESNGAIIHYSATPESSKSLEPSGFLLVDSGGQYSGGTTDITRTIALGPLSDEMKENYTAVLRCNIELATSVFSAGTTGAQLDEKTRKPLQVLGLDYNHGTGHGVGHMLSVHEGPNTISPNGGSCPIMPGMITSNEPGVYLEGKYGIRLENEILCVEADKADDFDRSADAAGLLDFETLTLCPFEPDAILPGSLTSGEIEYLNHYHRQVYDSLAPLLEEDVREWLAEVTKPI